MTADWSSDSFRKALLAMVRRRVPERDAEDVVQAVLAEAVTSDGRPPEPEAARKWIWGVARNKVADYHRRARRETFELPELTAPVPEAALHELLHWAVGELPPGADAQRTFAWLLREGEGEKLEDIAQSEQLPATQVRQRVSRLRRLFRERWALQAAALLAAVLGVYLVWRRARPGDPTRPRELRPIVGPSAEELAARTQGRVLRAEALRDCAGARWSECLAGLNRARALDPAGDADAAVGAARSRAEDALREPRVPDAGLPAPLPVLDVGDGRTSLGTSDTTSLSGPTTRRRARRAGDGGTTRSGSSTLPGDSMGSGP